MHDYTQRFYDNHLYVVVVVVVVVSLAKGKVCIVQTVTRNKKHDVANLDNKVATNHPVAAVRNNKSSIILS